MSYYHKQIARNGQADAISWESDRKRIAYWLRVFGSLSLKQPQRQQDSKLVVAEILVMFSQSCKHLIPKDFAHFQSQQAWLIE